MDCNMFLICQAQYGWDKPIKLMKLISSNNKPKTRMQKIHQSFVIMAWVETDGWKTHDCKLTI